MKRIFFWAILAMMYSCNSSEKGTAESKDEKKTEQGTNGKVVSDRPADSKGKFLVKFATIEFESEIMGMKQNMLMFIDKYGELSFVEMTGNFMGTNSHNISIIKDGFEYNIDLVKKTGQKVPYKTENNPDDIDFTALTAEVMKKFNMKKEGTEEFLGRKCDKYSIDQTTTKMKGYYLVWMGIPLKTDITVAGMAMKIIARKVDLDTKISPDKFDIPQGITITEGPLPAKKEQGKK